MSGKFYVMRRVPCPTCGGDGLVWRHNKKVDDLQQESCPKCGEAGHHLIEVPLEVALKALGVQVREVEDGKPVTL